jgi:MFS family permease
VRPSWSGRRMHALAPDASVRAVSAARRRDLRLIVVATALSSLGDELALIALMIKVFDLRHSAFSVTALLLAGLMPLVLLTPVAGLLVDRSERVQLVAVTSAAQGLIAFSIASTSSFPLILILAFLLGSGAAVASPALFAIVPAIAGERTTQANAWIEAGRYTGWVFAPILGGVIAQTVGPGVALVVDGASFLIIAAAALGLSIRCPAGAREEKEKGAARRGFAFIGSDPILRIAISVIAVTVLFAAVDGVAEIFFAREVLHAGSLGYGALASAWLAGMVVGATAIARRLQPPRLTPAVILSSVGLGACVFVAAAMGITVPAITLFFVAGIGNGVQNVSIRSLIHRSVPEELLGRVFAAYFGLTTTMQLGATALGGLLVGGFGARTALMVSGGGGVVLGAAGFVWFGFTRKLIHVPEADELVLVPESPRVAKTDRSQPS